MLKISLVKKLSFKNIKALLKAKALTVLGIVLFFVLFFYFDLASYIDINYVLREKKKLFSLYQNFPALFILAYFFIYVVCAALSVPGAAVLTLIAGFIFDFLIACLVVSLASTAGAVLAFLMSRFLIRDFVQKKFAKHLKTINEGLKKNGIFYLISLRLLPIFPFFLVNMLMAVTPISTKHFIIGSFFGMLPMTFVYVNAGRQLAYISDIRQIFSKEVIVSFLLLALLPWIIKVLLKAGKALYSKIKKHMDQV